MQVEAFGDVHGGDVLVAEAEGALAAFAVEVRVQVAQAPVPVFAAVALLRAEGVLGVPASVLYLVHEVVAEEERERAVYGGLVHGAQFGFQVGERNGASCLHHGLQDEQAQGGGFDFPLFQYVFG